MINQNNEPIEFDAEYEDEEDKICPKCYGDGTNLKGQNCKTCEGTGKKLIIEKKKS